MDTFEGVSILTVGFVGLWIAGLFLLVFFAILRRKILLNGLMVEPLTGNQAPLSRPQLLISTFAGLGAYAALALANLGHPDALPEAPPWLIGVFAGSHVLYLGGRTVSGLVNSFFKGS